MIENTGNVQTSAGTAQADNRMTIEFTFGAQAIAKYSDLKNGLSMSVNFSDKANKKLSTLAGPRRRSTNALTFRSSSLSNLLSDLPSGAKNQIYNIVSYHKQGVELVGLMSGSKVGDTLRSYCGFKLL